MTDEAPRQTKGRTWGDFIAFAREFGVTIETLGGVAYEDGSVGNADYLCRQNGSEVLTYAMPKAWTEDRRLGFGRVANICERLKLPRWPDWLVEF